MAARATGAKRTDVAIAYLRLPHALPILVVLATTAALTFVVDRDAPWSTRVGILLAMLGAQVVIGVVNELVDLEADRIARPEKPLVSGLVSRRGALMLLWLALGVMVAAGVTLGVGSFALCALGCAIGVAYSLWFKRTVLAWLPYLVAVPLLPIWVATTLGSFRYAWLMVYPLGCCALFGVQIAQSVPDVAADREARIESLTTKLGEKRSLYVCWSALAISAALILVTGSSRVINAVAASVVIAGIVGNAVLYFYRPRVGVKAAFPIAATATAVMGVTWVYTLSSS